MKTDAEKLNRVAKKGKKRKEYSDLKQKALKKAKAQNFLC